MRRQLGDACFERLDDVCGRAIVAETGEEHIAGLSLNERRDRRLVFGTDQQVSIPVARNAPLVGLGRALSDRDHLRDSTARVAPAPGAARRATRPQVRGQLPAQLAAPRDRPAAADNAGALRTCGSPGRPSSDAARAPSRSRCRSLPDRPQRKFAAAPQRTTDAANKPLADASTPLRSECDTRTCAAPRTLPSPP